MITAELNLEINQVNVQSVKIFLQHFVYLKRILSDMVNLLLGGKSQCQCVIAVDKRVAQFVILIAEFQSRAFKLDALLHSHLLGKAACGIIADDYLQGNNLPLLHSGFPVI